MVKFDNSPFKIDEEVSRQQLACHVCDYRAESDVGLFEHIEDLHCTQCDECETELYDPRDLQLHKATAHRQDLTDRGSKLIFTSCLECCLKKIF